MVGLKQSTEATGIYLGGCPNCGGPVGDDRLLARLPCPRCLPERVAVESIVDVADELRRRGTLRESSRLALYAEVEREARKVEELFERATASRLWSAQRAWVRRVLKHRSFAIIAPTGVGKTTFGVLMAIYFASKCHEGEEWCKSYIVVPTTPLVKMVEEKARKLAEAAGLDVRILAIHSKLSLKERRERLKRLLEGDYDILITTSRFMLSRLNEIMASVGKVGDENCSRKGFRFVFVDDVDAVLKSSRSVEAVLRLVGFPAKVTSRPEGLGWRLLSLRQRLARIIERISREGLTDRLRSEMEKIYREIEEVEEFVRKCRENAASLVVSSATGRPRGRMVRLFTILLGFQAGSRSETIRNIVDAYTLVEERDLEEKVAEIVSMLVSKSRKCGGLVYVPVDKGSAYAEKLAEYLKAAGIRAEPFTSKNVEALERFRKGEVDVLVGVAVYYGVAVRGLDIPERICYAVFAGAPRLKFSAKFEDPHPVNIIRALALLADHAPRDVAEEAERKLARLRRIYQRLSQAAASALADELKRGEAASPVAKEFSEALEFIRKALSRSDVWEALEKADDIAIVREGDRSYILLPDPATYIQASGRTSRLFAGGITKGLSIVVESDYRIMNGLIRRTRWWADIEWKDLSQISLDDLVKQLEESRRELMEVLEGKRRPETVGHELVTTALMIVESPNKARTIASFFGRPSVRELGPLRVYEVSTGDYMLLIAASGGHVYDLVKPATPTPKLHPTWLLEKLKGSLDNVDPTAGVNIHGVVAVGKNRSFYPVYTPLARCMVCGSQWPLTPEELEVHMKAVEEGKPSPLKCPKCGSRFVKTSWDVIEALRDLASEVDVVFIGTDPDTEGEKIGWDLASLIAPYARALARIEFHEITRKAILEAIHNAKPYGTHKMTIYVREKGEEMEVPAANLVKAQIVRRVEDRWIGFTLSPILWSRFWYNMYCQKKAEKLVETLLKKLAKEKADTKVDRSLLERLSKPIEKLRYLAALALSVGLKGKQLESALRLINSCCSNGLPKSVREVQCKPALNYNLSAGRVQTPVLGWVVERYLANRTAKLVVRIDSKEADIHLTVDVTELPGPLGEKARSIMLEVERVIGCLSECIRNGCRGENCAKLGVAPTRREEGYVISNIEEKLNELSKALGELFNELDKIIKRRPPRLRIEVLEKTVEEVKPLPPYTTDALLADAAAKLRIPPPIAMKLAQDLFELGLITYHRTDSTRVSDTGLAIAREYLREVFGERASQLFAPRTWGIGGAHEAIRPTKPIDVERLRKLIEEGVIQLARPLTRNHLRLYDLIFRRFIASQMKPARLVRQTIKVTVTFGDYKVERTLDIYTDVIEEGFLKFYPIVEVRKPVSSGEYSVSVRPEVTAYGRLLTDSEIVRMMRERGIGRPSTYAKIVETLFRRGYVVHIKREGRITGQVAVTDKGKHVYDYLITLFPDLVSENVTRELEEEMDKVERGVVAHTEVLDKVLQDLVRALKEARLEEYIPFKV